MKKLRVCLTSLAVYPDHQDGSAKFERSVYEELKKRGHDITLLTVKWGEGFKDPNIITIDVPKFRFLWIPKFALTFRKYLKKHEFDIIQANGSRGSLPILLSKKDFITTIHDVGPFQANFSRIPGLRWLEKKNAKQAKLILAVTESAGEEISKYMDVPLEKIRVVSEAISQKFKPLPEEAQQLKEKLNIKGPVLFYVGRIAFYKGIGDIIKAYKIAKEKIPELNLLIGGKPTIKETNIYEQWKAENPDIKFLGPIPDELMAVYYSMADIFVTYSFAAEGFGLTPVEALACGTPVICSSMPAFMEILQDAAEFVEPKRPELLAKQFIRYIENPEIGKQKIQKSEQLLKKYSWEQVINNIENVWQEILSEREKE